MKTRHSADTAPPRRPDFNSQSFIQTVTMNFRLTLGVAALACLVLASCTPYDESRNRKPIRRTKPNASVAAPEQQALQDQREAMKAKEELARREAARIAAETTPPQPTTTEPAPQPQPQPQPQPPAPPVVEKKPEYKYATKVPGKDGFVISPYNNKMIDVRGMAPGTLVQDPTYTGAGKGYFRVP